MRAFFLLAPCALVVACAAEAVDYAKLSRQGADGVGIDGYSPVSYFSEGRAEPGNPKHAVVHNGVMYWLRSAEQVDSFKADPDRYQPAHGGWCSLMLTGSGQMTPANPESFKILDDRLLLFWSGDFKGTAIDGVKNWISKFDNAAGEMALLRKADATWNKLLSGKAKQNVVLFSPGDQERISPERLQRAKKQFE